MRSHTSTVVLLSVIAFTLAGCGSSVARVPWRDAGASSAIAGLSSVSLLLTAAGEGAGPDEVDTSAIKPAPPVGEGVGVLAHVGFFMAAAAETVSFDPNVMVGAVYELPFLRSESLALEVGVDYASVSNDEEQLSSEMLLVSASARFAVGALYLTGSGCLLNENYDDAGDSGTNTGLLIGLGVGYSPLEGKWDVRGAYHIIPGSENLGGIITMSGGYAF